MRLRGSALAGVVMLLGLGAAAPDGPDGGSAPPTGDADWLARAERHLSAVEYEASDNGLGLQAPNRAHGFRTYFDARGISVFPREADAGEADVRMHLSRLGRGESLAAVPEGVVSSAGSRVEIRRPGVVEWYENGPDGLEQGFTLADPPRGRGAVVLELALESGRAQATGGSVLLTSRRGARIDYGALAVLDAAGSPVPAELAVPSPTRIQIVVRDDGVLYPLTIDPVLTNSAETQIDSAAAGAGLGVSVASAGDVNGDTIGDVVIGASLFDGGQTDEGAVFLFLGHTGGIASGTTLAADARLEGNVAGAIFGFSVASAGDVNGDGFDDIVVGAPDMPPGGYAYVFHGCNLNDSGCNGGLRGSGPATAATAIGGESGTGELFDFGWDVAGPGDLNGDGYDDVVVGAPNRDSGGSVLRCVFSGVPFACCTGPGTGNGLCSDEGRVDVFLGGAGGIPSGAQTNTASAFIRGDVPDGDFGESVAGGDFNDDGRADVLIGARYYEAGSQTDEGAAFVFFGPVSGTRDALQADAIFESNWVGAEMGEDVSGAEDVNGDGIDDILVSANDYTSKASVFVFHGSTTLSNGTPASAAAIIRSDQAGDGFGASIAGVGDVDGDGDGDILIGARFHDVGPDNNAQCATSGVPWACCSGLGSGSCDDDGAAFLYSGGASLSGTLSETDADVVLEMGGGRALFGSHVAGAGDVNNDGHPDVIVGAPLHGTGGAAFLYLGVGCGNGTVEAGEQCDDGNLDAGDCCSPTCSFEPATVECRAAVDACDAAEFCDGASPVCPADGPAPATTPCDDADACTTADACDGLGACVGGPPPDCDDANACTTDACDPGTGCTNDPVVNGTSCDDGDACTTADACSSGACLGGPPLVCNDANVCTDDSCNPASGCVFANNTDFCDDGDACTTADACSGGACLGGPALVCDDANVCTDDSCNPASGCVFANNTGPCDDGVFCNGIDVCSGGSCVHPGDPCPGPDADGDCSESCDELADACTANDPDLVACDDADACTAGDTCSTGVCVAGALVDCDDLDDCTADACDALSGCSNTPIGGCAGPVPGPGDLLVVDRALDTLFTVDPATGDRGIVSSPSVGAGAPFSNPLSLAAEATGSAVIADTAGNLVWRVDPVTGDRVVVSSSSVGSGPSFGSAGIAVDVAVARDGDLLVNALNFVSADSLFRVDPATGDRTIFSSGSVGSGPPLDATLCLVEERTGDVLVGEVVAPALLRVDPLTGDRDVLSSTSVGAGALFVEPTDLALERDGNVLLVDSQSAALFRIDPATGDRTVVSSSGVGAGPAFSVPTGVAVAPDDVIWVVDDDLPAVFRVDPVTGDRTIVSDAVTGGGTPLDLPERIAVVPPKPLPFEATLEIDIPGLFPFGPITAQGTGVARINDGFDGAPHLSSFSLMGGTFSASGSALTGTTAGGITNALLSFGNGWGAFADTTGGFGGSMPVPGILRLCLLSSGCGATAPLPLTQSGTHGVGIGWPPITWTGTFGGTPILAALSGNPWTSGLAVANGTMVRSGFAHGPASSTTRSAVAQPSGVIQLVTPISIGGGSPAWPVPLAYGGFATLTVRFVPEPSGLLPLGGGLAVLMLAFSRRRARREAAAGSSAVHRAH